MSAISGFMTQGTFWWGMGLGTCLGAGVTAVGNYFNNKISDERKVSHDLDAATRTESREDRKESEERLRKVCTEYIAQCEAVITGAIDVKGLFNVLRDAAQDPSKFDPKSGQSP